MNYNIRKAKQEDAQRILELLRQIALFHRKGRPDIFSDKGPKYDLEAVKEKIADEENYVILVAENSDGYVMGYAISQFTDFTGNQLMNDFKSLYLDDLFVDEKYRSLSIGSMLLEATKQEAKTRGCYNLDLNVWSFNEGAIRFYERHGFKEQKRRLEIIL